MFLLRSICICRFRDAVVLFGTGVCFGCRPTYRESDVRVPEFSDTDPHRSQHDPPMNASYVGSMRRTRASENIPNALVLGGTVVPYNFHGLIHVGDIISGVVADIKQFRTNGPLYILHQQCDILWDGGLG